MQGLITTNIIYYNLLINTRLKNRRTNLGNIYFENMYTKITNNTKIKVTC